MYKNLVCLKQIKYYFLFITFFSFLSFKQQIKNVVVKDIDGNFYSTTKIGTQTWLTSNLNVSHFRNGDVIKEVKTIVEWRNSIKNRIPAWCYYDNESNKKCGKLYNWFAVNDKRGLAPKNCHIPSQSEWENLDTYLGGWEEAGKYLKSDTKWDGLNSYDFNAIGSGGCNENGFYPTGKKSLFMWSDTPWDGVNNIYVRILTTNQNSLTIASYLKSNGLSIRCILD